MADKSSKMEQGYKDGLKAYKGREGSKVEEFVTKNVTDPLDKIISGDKDKEYVEGFKKAREEILGYKKGGAVKKPKKMAGGGMTRPPVVNPRQVKNQAHAAQNQKRNELRAQSAAATKAQSVPASSVRNSKPSNPNLTVIRKRPRFAQGGSVSARADGCAQRGKTKGKMV